MKRRGSLRLIRGLGLALAVAAVAAPAAQAKPIPRNYHDSSGAVSGSRVYADDLHAAVPYVPVRIYADDRHSKSPISSSTVLVASRLYADDLHAPLTSSLVSDKPRGYAPINTLARPEVPPVATNMVSESSSFDWNDAIIGAGVMFMLLGFGVAILVGRQPRRSRPAAV